MDELLTVREMAAYLKIGQPTIQRWCAEGTLPAMKIGKFYRIRRSALEAWHDSRRVVV